MKTEEGYAPSITRSKYVPLCLGMAGVAFGFWLLFGLIPFGMGYGNFAQTAIENLVWFWDAEREPDWAHCPLALAISLGLFGWSLYKARGLEIRGENWAALGFVPVLFFYYCAYMIDIVQFTFLVMYFTLGVFIVWTFGWKFMKTVSFSYLFLIFIFPFPSLNEALALPLRHVMAEMSHRFMNFVGFGYENIRLGTGILSVADPAQGLAVGEKFRLEIADPCSGIRSLFALVMVTCLYAYFALYGFWRRTFMVFLALPLSVLGNFTRILMLAFGTKTFGRDFALGTFSEPSVYHMLSGYMVFAVALGGMLGIGFFLERKWGDRNKPGGNPRKGVA